ncbi:glucose 1-dehydrogenase [Rhodobium gokarnense]|uniref:NAD(P)-dependent dehydrogenase (Short-subunit alcohol dehydrogenase family) n=1 Tax=Rhodobium gokarnense TaxID=364296 RepID=A0ABT3HCZ1_9HYPH|nr:glucose 1-dehydrogenase [Rhodobium gokarnense]MCW2308273.1 NAD(P)-dependent dehydrogenase (short-subunit alcohol dehydrogenase family) [Rhodobium gokarnense]
MTSTARFLEGQVALVTGGGGGIGRSIACHYAKAGARVVVADLDDDAGAETVRQITDAGGTALFQHTDVASAEDARALVAKALSVYGKLDIACNNAGVAPPATPLAEIDDALWRRILSINLDGVFYGMRAQIPALLDNGGGVIVNVASILGQVGFPGMAPYVATKHAVVGLTKQVAVDYADKGVRAIAVGPAFIKTGMENNLDPEERSALETEHPVGRMGEPEEVGSVVAMVSAPNWTFVNGAYLPIDGGYLSR